jgi:hypothetical protein
MYFKHEPNYSFNIELPNGPYIKQQIGYFLFLEISIIIHNHYNQIVYLEKYKKLT